MAWRELLTSSTPPLARFVPGEMEGEKGVRQEMEEGEGGGQLGEGPERERVKEDGSIKGTN